MSGLGAAMAEAGLGGLFEHHAFLNRWGSAAELETRRTAMADLCRLFLAGPMDRDKEDREHAAALLTRLTSLCAAAHAAEAALSEQDMFYNPASRLVELRTGWRGQPRTVLSIAIEHEYRLLDGKSSPAERRNQVRERLARVFAPKHLTDAAIRSVVTNHVQRRRKKKPRRPR